MTFPLALTVRGLRAVAAAAGLCLLAPAASAQFGPTPMPKVDSPPINIPGTFAAVAINGKGGWGASIHRGGSLVAERDAIRRCGGGACRVVMRGAGRCVAFAQSRSGGYWYGHAFGNNRGAVQNVAMQGCSRGAPRGTCRLEHVNCL